MTIAEKIIKPKLGVLELAQQLGRTYAKSNFT